jgi:hypothetical protein
MLPTINPLQGEPVGTTQGDEWDGPWGSISPVPHSIETLCIQLETENGRPRIYYYPYRTIGKWNWSMDCPEILDIHVGGIQLTISGMGLRRLAEALNLGQLRLVHLLQPPALAGEIRILAILIGDVKT